MNKLRLIPGWRHSWRYVSVQLSLLGTLLCTFFAAFPDAILYAWNLIPPDLKAALPQHWVPIIGVALFVLATLARIVHQPKTQAKIEQKVAEKEQQP